MFYSVALFIIRILYRIIFRIKIHGWENYDLIGPDEGLIICSNHQSNFDPVTLAVVFDRQIHFMAKKELFEIPVFATLIGWLNAFPIDRGSNDIKSLKTAIRLAKDSKTLGIFIEGSRVDSYKPENAKSGPVLISKMADVKILPVYIETDYKIFRPIDIYIRSPLNVDIDKFEGNNSQKLKKQAEEILEIIYLGD